MNCAVNVNGDATMHPQSIKRKLQQLTTLLSHCSYLLTRKAPPFRCCCIEKNPEEVTRVRCLLLFLLTAWLVPPLLRLALKNSPLFLRAVIQTGMFFITRLLTPLPLLHRHLRWVVRRSLYPLLLRLLWLPRTVPVLLRLIFCTLLVLLPRLCKAQLWLPLAPKQRLPISQLHPRLLLFLILPLLLLLLLLTLSRQGRAIRLTRLLGLVLSCTRKTPPPPLLLLRPLTPLTHRLPMRPVLLRISPLRRPARPLLLLLLPPLLPRLLPRRDLPHQWVRPRLRLLLPPPAGR